MDPQKQDIIKQAAIAGGNAIQALASSEISHYKGNDPHNFVTKADLASEKAIIDIIKANFPKDTVLSEEDKTHDLEKAAKAKHLWVIDPLDGTNNFKHNRNLSCVSIGYIEEGKGILAAVFNFYTQELYTAQIGKGAYLNGKKIQVAQESRLSHIVVATDNAPGDEITKQNLEAIFSIKPLPWITMMGSGVLGLCSVASGKVDLFIHGYMHPWDHAAGFLIVEEAGGIIRDWEGKKTNFLTKSSISGNKDIVEAFLKHMKANSNPKSSPTTK